MPFADGELSTLLAGLGRDLPSFAARSGGKGSVREPRVKDFSTHRPEEIGDILFRALFSGQVLDLYNRSLGSLSGQVERGLRLRLYLDPSHPDLLPVCRLPWELLRRDGRDFLGLESTSPIVRSLLVDCPAHPLPLEAPLRVLVVISSPKGVPPLDVEKERQLIESALARQDGVEVEILEKPTRSALRAAFLRRPVHALHFIGHGGSNQRPGLGTLVFETPERKPDFVSGKDLATLLSTGRPPAIVVLNACNTGWNGPAAEDPFGSVAAALVKAGLLAVVAMQFPITDQAALAFSKAFYQHLAEGDPVDAAVGEGRLAIRLDDCASHEWITPVLFLRTPDGRILDPIRVAIWEKEEAEAFLSGFADGELTALLHILEPGGLGRDQSERARHWLAVAARRGGEEWVRFLERLLAVRSPFPPFNGSLDRWRASAGGTWHPDGEELVGLGEDPKTFSDAAGLDEVSLLTWEGLRFRNGSLSSQVLLPLLSRGEAAGLALRCGLRTGLFGILRGGPSGSAALELWRRQGDRLAALASTPVVANPTGHYDLSLRLKGRKATLRCGETMLQALPGTELLAGFAGLVKFAGTTAHFSRLDLEVPFPPDSDRRSR